MTGLLAAAVERCFCRVEPEALITAGEELVACQEGKPKDLGLIYTSYQALEVHGLADPRGRLDRLAVQLEDTLQTAKEQDVPLGDSEPMECLSRADAGRYEWGPSGAGGGSPPSSAICSCG